MRNELRAGLATSFGWGATVAVAGYAVTRSLQASLGHEMNPANAAWSPHSAFFWRCLTMLYAGGMAAFVAWVASRRHVVAAARGLARAIPIVALFTALQTIFFP